jgi:hypothetical protein
MESDSLPCAAPACSPTHLAAIEKVLKAHDRRHFIYMIDTAVNETGAIVQTRIAPVNSVFD